MKVPTQPYRALRAVVATAVIAVVLGLWARGQLAGEPLDMLWDVVVLALLVASGYAIYGRQTMGQAVEDAQSIADGSSGDDSSGGADSQEGGDGDA